MAGYTPRIEVTVDGQPVSGLFYSRLVSATFRDEPGQKTDSCTIRLDDARNEIALPRKGASLAAALGYLETGVLSVGTYKVQTVTLEGGEDGEFITIVAKAAELTKSKLKDEGRAAYEKKTFGQIVEALAKAAGLSAKVDPELAGIMFAYKARVDQSRIDFLTRLGDEVGAVIKPANGMLIAAKRGSSRSVSGKPVPAIMITRRDCESWRINPDGRQSYGAVVTGWIDQKTGKRRTERKETGREGPDFMVKDPLPDQPRAKKAGEAEAERLNRATGDGEFVLYGRPAAQAEAIVMASGFRSGIDGEWRASAVEHVFEERGFRTTIEVKSPESGKDKD